ncbi:MAG: zinc ABC transporter substrate-binding protein [Ignisphaera sp.]|nr:zinc ABC transporter substrate-binding protein [Ignisphaera sp.]MCX8167495.1 zinc ABC transporter substrate-binding protein [Ignisphaera sp.]MDW8084641.1 zinc ABC transporter substrate-binding protein [Ignisphaera sp.]
MSYSVGRIVLIVVTMFLIHSIPEALLSSDGLYIIVTYPYLYDDVKKVVCSDDIVINLIKPGVDPHEYHLTPTDADMIRRASIVVSTAHTHFELKIKELIEKGEIGATLIEIPYLESMKILKNPSTGMENYHEMLLHPENYVTFMNHLKRVLIKLRPQCSKIYEENVNQFILRIQKIVNTSFKLNRMAVLDTPIIQYVAVWLGLNVSHILVSEEEIPIAPRDVEEVENVLRGYNDSIAVVTNGSKASQYLIELANKYGRKVLVLPNPLLSSSIISTLEDVIRYANAFATNEKMYITSTPFLLQLDRYRVILIALIVMTVAVSLLFRLRRWQF